ASPTSTAPAGSRAASTSAASAKSSVVRSTRPVPPTRKSAAYTSRLRASSAAQTVSPGAPPATSASASRVGTAATGSPPANATPFTNPSPMRSPVNDPGPMETASPSMSSIASPARARTRARRPGGEPTWERDAVSDSSARMMPLRTPPAVAVQVAVSSPRTIRSSALHEAMDVVVEHEHHQAEQQEQPDLLRKLAMPLPERPPEHGLDPEEREMTAVEGGNRQEVEHPEVDREEGEHAQVVARPGARLLAGRPCDRDGPPKLAQRDPALDHEHEALRHHVGGGRRLLGGHAERVQRPDALPVVRGLDADQVDLAAVLAEHRPVVPQLRRHRDGELLAVPLDAERQRGALGVADRLGERLPGRRRAAVDREHLVAGLEPRLLRRRACGDAADPRPARRHPGPPADEEERVDQEREQEVHGGTREHDRAAAQRALRREGALGLGHHLLLVVLAQHLDVAAEWHRRHRVLGLVAASREQH